MKRTAAVTVDESFQHDCGDVTKTWTDPNTGRRYIRGVATGIAEDRDGERVSRRAIAKMAAQSLAGDAVKITASHDQDWLSEIGAAVRLEHDPENDELSFEAELPPAGEDPIADKAWKRATQIGAKPLGASIGGKLRKAFHELVPRGATVKRRKVLDDIHLRHIMLTDRPAYPQAFVESVAKTFTADSPDVDDTAAWEDEPDGQEVLDAEKILQDALDVLKASKAEEPTEDQDEDQQPPADPAADAPPGEEQEPPAATADPPAEPSDAEDAQSLPMARHLSCPNCGHEFAAELPDEAGETTTTDADERSTTEKRETPMGAQETLAEIRKLAEAAEADVEKKVTPDPPADPGGDDGLTDVEKMIAASHQANETAISDLEASTEKGFETVTKAIKDLADTLASRPQGRRSTARHASQEMGVDPPGEQVSKRNEADVANKPLGELTRDELRGLTDREIVAKADTSGDALKAINKRDLGH